MQHDGAICQRHSSGRNSARDQDAAGLLCSLDEQECQRDGRCCGGYHSEEQDDAVVPAAADDSISRRADSGAEGHRRGDCRGLQVCGAGDAPGLCDRRENGAAAAGSGRHHRRGLTLAAGKLESSGYEDGGTVPDGGPERGRQDGVRGAGLGVLQGVWANADRVRLGR